MVVLCSAGGEASGGEGGGGGEADGGDGKRGGESGVTGSGDEDHIITMSPFQNEGRRVPYIRVNEIKNSGGHCMTSRIGELYLLAKFATHTREAGVTSNLPKNTTSY
jgi:hypothetical protein